MNIVIPICGVGKRFLDDGYTLPKPLVKSLGKSIIFWNIENLNIDDNDDVYIVYRDEFKKYNFESLIKNKFKKVNFTFISIKDDTRGASETVLCALEQMNEDQLKELTIVVDSDNFYQDDIISVAKSMNDNLIFYKKDFDQNPIYSYILDTNGIVGDIKEKEKISDNACVGAYCFKSGILLKNSIRSVLIQDIKQKNEYYISSIYKFLIDNQVPVFSKEINGFNCLGTPNQLKSFSSNLNPSAEKYRFCFDLDNTLVTYPEVDGDYTTVRPIKKTIDFLNFLKHLGHIIIIYTARRMKTHSGNVGKVQADISKLTFDTLDKFGINYDEVYFGKPYAHFYIDDLSLRPSDDLEKETGFYNIHPETRSHNKIEIFDKCVIKYSTSIEGERHFYNNIPENIKLFFPDLIESGDNFIKLKKICGVPISFLNANNTLTDKILYQILVCIGNIHKSYSPINASDINIYSNYFDKVSLRLNNFDFSGYPNFGEVSLEVLNFLKNYENSKSGIFGVIHGDPVFTNILIDVENNIKMIDMRGKVGENLTIYGDIFYDYAKIYQSLIGYDHILMNRDINVGEENIMLFEEYIKNNFNEERLNDIKQITKSLILSLIPIHNNEKCVKYYKLIDRIK